MGCGLSLFDDDVKKSRQISRELRKDFSRDSLIVKILLLGAGESGKSTIVKQMKLLHPVNNRKKVGFSDEEKAEARSGVHANISESILSLIEAVDRFGMNYSSNKREEDRNRVLRYYYDGHGASGPPPETIVGSIKNLWNSPVIRSAYERRNEFQLNDSAAYFLDDVERFLAKSYEPTDQDILRMRVKTTGIVKIEFQFQNLTFHMFDVGGQRSERKKWIHCFDNVTAVLFVISLSEYDQVLYEDGFTNRMHESLNLFASIVNNVHFRLKPFIVFFNKRDLFEEKLERGSSLCHAFPEYRGDNSLESASVFVEDTYTSQSETTRNERAIYTHFITATDTGLVHRVFTDVTEIILNEILRDIGLN